MFGSRMTAAGVVFVLIVAFFFGMWLLVGPMVAFMTPNPTAWREPAGPDDGTTDFPNTMEPTRLSLPPAACFPVLGLAVGLGSLVWLRFARRGPYLRVIAVLLGVAVVTGLMMAVYCRYSIAGEFSKPAAWESVGITMYYRMLNEVHAAVGLVPLAAAGGVMAVATAVGLATGLLVKQKTEPAQPDAAAEAE